MTDFDDPANKLLTEHEPSVERLADGPTTVPCKVCGSTAPPDARGMCATPTCRAARVGNKLASVHDGRARLTPADLATRDALLDRLFAERGGRSALDIVSQLRVEDYATAQIQLGKVTRRLEMLGAVSTEGRKRSSLVDTYNVFSARVERLAAELPSPRQTHTPDDDYSNVTEDELIARLEVLLKHAIECRDSKIEYALPRLGERAVDAAVADEQQASPAVTIQPTGAPVCSYGCGSLDRCAELKAHSFDVWCVLHVLDPEEVARRGEYASSMRRP